MRVFLAAVVLLALLAPAALAKRAPTPAEATQIRAAVRAFIEKPYSPAASDNGIVRIRVSTVDRRFARVTLDSPSAGPSIMLLRKRASGWKVVAFGSADFSCSVAPAKVWTDLFAQGFCVSS